MRNFVVSVVIFGLVGVTTPSVFSAAKVEEQVVGPVTVGPNQQSPYVVSPRGVHLATVTRKGSRVVVTVDGVAGPRFEEIIEPGLAFIDPRPYANGESDMSAERPTVAFSKDGQRYAYVGRQSEEWVVMVDGKETFRLPALPRSGTDIRMEFTGGNGVHFLFARSGLEGYELWVDGKKWPGFYGSGGGGTQGTIDPLISADGNQVAVMMMLNRDKTALLLDGKDVGYTARELQFTADSKHLVGIATMPKGEAVILDGKPQFTAPGISSYYLAPVGNRIIAVATDGNQNYHLVVDGKPVDASRSTGVISEVIFSPDGKHYAAICRNSTNQFVVYDGKKGEEYQNINPLGAGGASAKTFLFSPDSSKLVYVAQAAGKLFVVTNDEESDGFDNGYITFKFSPDGKRFAYSALIEGGLQPLHLFVDQKLIAKLRMSESAATLKFSRNNARYGYIADTGRNIPDGGAIAIDAQPTGISGKFEFSPDAQHVVIAGYRDSDQKRGLFVDGKLVYENQANAPRYWGITPDSQHIFWMALEPAKSATAEPGSSEWVTYLDGKEVARCERNNAFGQLYTSMTRAAQKSLTAKAWTMGDDGALTFLAPAGDVVKRILITPDSDTSLAQLLSDPAGAGAKQTGKAVAPQIEPISTQPAVVAIGFPGTTTPSISVPSVPIPNEAQQAVNAGQTAAKDPPGAAVDAASQKAKDKADALAKKAKAWLDGLGSKKK